MFARGNQTASEAERNKDLAILFPEDDDPGTAAAVSAAQRTAGRFFFIHKSEARAQDSRLLSYEFLHSTFGEFLVARLAVSALRDLVAMRQVMLRQGRATALFTLAADVPAAILAKTLGIRIQAAIQWQKISAGDWTGYAADVSRRSRPRPVRPHHQTEGLTRPG